MFNQKDFLDRITTTVQQLEPTAEVFLYGSRARGDAREDSDWDFLILLDRKVTSQIKREIRDELYEVELETDNLISSIIRSKEEWHAPITKETPFYQAVKSDAILVSV